LLSSSVFLSYFATRPHIDKIELDLIFNFRENQDPFVNLSLPLDVFTFYVPYKLTLMLEMPESEVNFNIGMFMVESQILALYQTFDSKFSSMLKYKSSLIRFLSSVVYAIPMILGYENYDEKQSIELVIFDNLIIDSAATLCVNISKRDIQIFKSKLLVESSLTGIRYFNYYYPYITLFFFAMAFFIPTLITNTIIVVGLIYFFKAS